MLAQGGKARGSIHVSEAKDGSCRLESAKKTVSKIKGVLLVEANHMTHVLEIEYDPSKVSLDDLRNAIEDGN